MVRGQRARAAGQVIQPPMLRVNRQVEARGIGLSQIGQQVPDERLPRPHTLSIRVGQRLQRNYTGDGILQPQSLV